MSLPTSELKDRVEAKRKDLEARLHELKADTKGKTSEEAHEIEHKLDELGELVHDGWENISDEVSRRLNRWLS